MNTAVIESTTNSLAIATITMAVMVLLSLVAMALMYRHFHKLSLQQDATINSLRDELDAITSGSVGIGNRVDKLEKKAKLLSRRQYLYEVRQMQDKNYERAKGMINRGEPVEKVIKECKITKTEAELILLANRMNRVA
jgi:biopolymer transport protein ExbB/TolQ